MAIKTDLERRHKVMFAFVMIAGAGAGAYLRLKHVNLVDGLVYQDGREVNTKACKTITTWFFPMQIDYLAYFTEWMTFLRNDKFFGAADALFSEPEQRLIDGEFIYDTLSRDPYANSAQVNAVLREAFAQVQLPPPTRPIAFEKHWGRT